MPRSSALTAIERGILDDVALGPEQHPNWNEATPLTRDDPYSHEKRLREAEST
jgi:hypothetical protein